MANRISMIDRYENKVKEKAYKERISSENINFEATVIEKLMTKSFENRECLVCTKNFYYGNEFAFDANVSFYEVDTFSSGKKAKLNLFFSIEGPLCLRIQNSRGLSRPRTAARIVRCMQTPPISFEQARG